MLFAELGRSLRAAERLLLPPECLLCQSPVEGQADGLICGLCQSRWRRLPEPVCARCGQPEEAGLDCRLCTEWPPALRRVRSAVWFDGTVRSAVHQLKYEGWWRVSEAAALAAAHDGGCVAVSSEVGMGIVPDNALARSYRDVLGRVNAIWAEAADDALLAIAGRVLRLERA